MENTEKLNVYIPQEMKAQIHNDAMLFEIFKKNRRDVNINRFLSLLLCGYHDDFLHENNKSHQSILSILNSYNIPCKEKQEWGTTTSAKVFFRERNEEIYENYIGGIGIHELAHRFSLSEKSIQRILRNQRLALSKGAPSV